MSRNLPTNYFAENAVIHKVILAYATMAQMDKYQLRSETPLSVRKNLAAYPELLQDLLFGRGIKDEVTAEEFLNPDYTNHLHDPFSMKGMKEAVLRILQAIKNNEKTVIYSDYDADGIPGAVILHDFFKKIGYANFTNYIPHRHNEGFGLHLEAVDKFAEENVHLLITIDCGIADVTEVAHAKSKGIDVIVTDHHLCGIEVPAADVILNSKQNDCTYPYKMLCGAGVVFKLVQALIVEGKKQKLFDLKDGYEKWLLDMVGIATLSDMVPLKGENRVLAYYGLKVLRKSPRPGLQKLLSDIKVDQRYLSEDDIAFMVTPRINAASRMGLPMDAFELLSTTDEAKAGQLSAHLQSINNERKGIVASIVKEIRKHLEERKERGKVLVMGNPSWRPAVLGLAATSIVPDFGGPVFLWGRENGNGIKGSCRSDGSVSVMKLMEMARDFFADFGGHDMSGGYSIHDDKVHFLEEGLNSAYEKVSEAGFTTPKIFIDKKASFDDVSNEVWSMIDKLGPFGVENPKPLFMFENAELSGVKSFGKGNDHLELTFRNSRGRDVRSIGFFMNAEQFSAPVRQGNKINLIATMEKSYFRGRPELRLRIFDIV